MRKRSEVAGVSLPIVEREIPVGADLAKRALVERLESEFGYTVTATWGEEKYTPIAGSYSTCTVGPFSAVMTIPRGESEATLREVTEVLVGVVTKVAEVERDRKVTSFVGKLKGAIVEAKR
jgi:hypothetical protein